MLNILGENYYIDLDKIGEYVSVPPPEGFTGTPQNHIDVVKYELIRMMIETLIVENEEVDETLGLKNSELSIPFKFSFNSLSYKKLINKI
jgi:hypothetical protein